jgi:hypothetical protein
MSGDDFKWYDEINRAVVLRAYGSIAVHENAFGDVVVRQERDALEDEDNGSQFRSKTPITLPAPSSPRRRKSKPLRAP